MQNFHQKRVGRCLYGKIFLEARIPRKGSLNLLCVLPNPLLVIQIERSRILLRNLLYLLECHERIFNHLAPPDQLSQTIAFHLI